MINDNNRLRGILAASLLMTLFCSSLAAAASDHGLRWQRVTSGLLGASGATTGPDRALYVVEGATGTVARIDPRNGRKTPFASGLPPAFDFVGIGGPVDIEFIGSTGLNSLT